MLVRAHTRTHTYTHSQRCHTQSSKCTHIFHTRTLYGIVSISVTAEGLATRDCAGLSRHGPDFTGYKGSRLPLVSNSVLDKKKSFVWKKKLLIIITEKLQQCNFEYWLASQKHKERRSCRSNYNIYNILYLLFYISWARRASLATLKNGCQRKNKAKQEEARNTAQHASYSFNKSSKKTCNQSDSTNELEQVLFCTHWLMAELGWGIAGSAGFVQPPNNHLHSVVLNFGLFNNAFLVGSCCLS